MELIAAADASRPLNVQAIHPALVEPRQFDLPKGSSELTKVDYAPILAKWMTEEGEAKLMKDGDIYVVDTPVRNHTYRTSYRHRSLPILRAYLAGTRSISLPVIDGEESS